MSGHPAYGSKYCCATHINILAYYLRYWCKYLLILLYAHSLFFRTGTFKMATYFKEEWLSDPLFEKWLVKGADKKSAKCKTCQVQFNLSNMGRRAVTSHMEGKKTRSEIKASILLLQALTVNIHKTNRSGSRPIG